jgi:hypothetical protein
MMPEGFFKVQSRENPHPLVHYNVITSEKIAQEFV